MKTIDVLLTVGLCMICVIFAISTTWDAPDRDYIDTTINSSQTEGVLSLELEDAPNTARTDLVEFDFVLLSESGNIYFVDYATTIAVPLEAATVCVDEFLYFSVVRSRHSRIAVDWVKGGHRMVLTVELEPVFTPDGLPVLCYQKD